jgi:hypothetical protein
VRPSQVHILETHPADEYAIDDAQAEITPDNYDPAHAVQYSSPSPIFRQSTTKQDASTSNAQYHQNDTMDRSLDEIHGEQIPEEDEVFAVPALPKVNHD